MKVRLLFILLISWLSAQWTLAQISYGGTPLFLENSMLRSTNLSNFIEMPAFDLDSVLRMDKLNEGNMRGSFNFAYKFYTHIRKGIEGENRVLPDGTKVWRVGIRSNDAYSINLLFTKYHLPEGGKLFIYNA
ncbi:MAG: lysyl endopeptidase, partial [Candidatus Symbiothrix sp.]|nr:lysyl endopeptidase [Candidatus Symbiothrix sp.]